jgi:hypothetical protein
MGVYSGEAVAPTDRRFENADGTAHLAYYAEDVSFVWSGSAERPIQVCPGGYGEPPVAVVWPNLGHEGLVTLQVALRVFRETCDEWLEAHR